MCFSMILQKIRQFSRRIFEKLQVLCARLEGCGLTGNFFFSSDTHTKRSRGVGAYASMCTLRHRNIPIPPTLPPGSNSSLAGLYTQFKLVVKRSALHQILHKQFSTLAAISATTCWTGPWPEGSLVSGGRVPGELTLAIF